MKTIFSLLILFASIVCNAQGPPSETINWDNLAAFSAKKINFKSSEIDFECKDCKCLEIKTQSGVTGFYILGNSQFNMKNKKIETYLKAFHSAPIWTYEELELFELCLNKISIFVTGKYPAKKHLISTSSL